MESSRRDDLISLVYFMVFYLDADRLKFLNEYIKLPKSKQFDFCKKSKLQLGPKEICGSSLKDT